MAAVLVPVRMFQKNMTLDLEVLMCENSKLQAELEEIQDEFVETMGEFIRLKQEWEGC